MTRSNPSMAQQVAEAAIAFEQRLTGRTPHSVTVVLSDNTLLITLHGALSPAERALAQSPEGAAKVQGFHRQLFDSSADALRQEIARITGAAVQESAAEIEAPTGTIVHAFTNGTVVQFFLLADNVPPDCWSSSPSPGLSSIK